MIKRLQPYARHLATLVIYLVTTILSALAVAAECPLEVPSAVFSGENTLLAQYSLEHVSTREVSEIIVLKSGPAFHILSSGCEYETLKVRFEPKLLTYPADGRMVYRAAASALRTMSVLHPNTAFDLIKIALVLEVHAHDSKPVLGAGITVEDRDVPVTVTVSDERAHAGRVLVEIEVSRGPA